MATVTEGRLTFQQKMALFNQKPTAPPETSGPRPAPRQRAVTIEPTNARAQPLLRTEPTSRPKVPELTPPKTDGSGTRPKSTAISIKIQTFEPQPAAAPALSPRGRTSPQPSTSEDFSKVATAVSRETSPTATQKTPQRPTDATATTNAATSSPQVGSLLQLPSPSSTDQVSPRRSGLGSRILNSPFVQMANNAPASSSAPSLTKPQPSRRSTFIVPSPARKEPEPVAPRGSTDRSVSPSANTALLREEPPAKPSEGTLSLEASAPKSTTDAAADKVAIADKPQEAKRDSPAIMKPSDSTASTNSSSPAQELPTPTAAAPQKEAMEQTPKQPANSIVESSANKLSVNALPTVSPLRKDSPSEKPAPSPAPISSSPIAPSPTRTDPPVSTAESPSQLWKKVLRPTTADSPAAVAGASPLAATPQGSESDEPSDWTTSRVLAWLDEVGYSQYKSVFAEHNITGAQLLELRTEDLTTRLGVKSLQCRMLAMKISTLKEEHKKQRAAADASAAAKRVRRVTIAALPLVSPENSEKSSAETRPIPTNRIAQTLRPVRTPSPIWLPTTTPAVPESAPPEPSGKSTPKIRTDSPNSEKPTTTSSRPVKQRPISMKLEQVFAAGVVPVHGSSSPLVRKALISAQRGGGDEVDSNNGGNTSNSENASRSNGTGDKQMPVVLVSESGEECPVSVKNREVAQPNDGAENKPLSHLTKNRASVRVKRRPPSLLLKHGVQTTALESGGSEGA